MVKKPKILIVDDEKEITETISAILEEEGFKVSSAFDGQEALLKVEKENPDLIILDIMLPKIDGFKLYRLIRFDEKYREIPIVVLTARVKDLARLKEVGISEAYYIEKPFRYETLIEKVYEALGREKPAKG